MGPAINEKFLRRSTELNTNQMLNNKLDLVAIILVATQNLPSLILV